MGYARHFQRDRNVHYHRIRLHALSLPGYRIDNYSELHDEPLLAPRYVGAPRGDLPHLLQQGE